MAPAQHGAPCDDEVCITCSDQAVAVRVIEVLPSGMARVETGVGVEEVSVALVDAVIGDTVLVHAREAIAGPRGTRAAMTDAAGPPGGVEALYPFLYPNRTDIEAVLEAVRRSTVEKANEIVALRDACLERYGELLVECAGAMAGSFRQGAKLFAFGNGGSSTDAQDVATLFLAPSDGRRPLPATCLTSDVAVLTALANDIGFEVVFARQLAAFSRPGDVALGLSTSGNSDNLIRAFDEAGRRGLLTVGLAGYDGGRMAEAETIDYLFVVPSSSVHRIQEAQTTLYHVLWELTRELLDEADGRSEHVPGNPR